MRIVVCFLLVYLSMVLETSVAVNISIAGVSPSFIVIFLTILLFWIEDIGVYSAAVFGGIVLDIASGAPLGLNALRYLLTAVFFTKLLIKRNNNYPFIPMMISFLWVVLSESFVVFMFYLLRQPILTTVDAVFLKGCYTAILMLPTFLICKKLFNLEQMNRKVHFEMTLIQTKK